MNSLEIAGRFAAFAWYINSRQAPSRTAQTEARRFSEQNWQVFLPVADEGWGRLLLRVAKARRGSQYHLETVNRSIEGKLAIAG